MVQPFLLESSRIRGNLTRLGPLVDGILSRHAYPEPVAGLLGQMLSLTVMLSSLMRFEGIFSLQTKGDGPIGMMLADLTSAGELRGYAGFDPARLEAALARHAAPGVPELLGRGHLAYTVDQGPPAERYQGIVELSGPTLADCLQHYFRQSEQIRSGLVVAAGKQDGTWRSAGLVLQRIPPEGGRGRATGPAGDEEDWRRAMLLQASCTEGELLDASLPVNDLLYRLFHEEGVRVFRRRPLRAGCRCSRARLEKTLRAMPRAEIEELMIDGVVVVTCEFCSTTYRFDSAGLDRIYAT